MMRRQTHIDILVAKVIKKGIKFYPHIGIKVGIFFQGLRYIRKMFF